MASEGVPEQRPQKRRRRRRRQKEGGAGLAGLLPHMLTTLNLAAGFYAIVKSSTGDPLTASYAIFVAGIADTLDGRAARLVGSSSRFGTEYDSIADTVSFGVAPAVIAFHAGAFLELDFWTGWVMAFVYTACASLRLARFNVSAGRYVGRFDGLPSPMAGAMVVSTVWFTGFLREQGFEFSLPAVLPAVALALVGLLMVSAIPYRSLKHLNPRSYRARVFTVLFLIVVALRPQVTCFVVALAYVASGPLEWYWQLRHGGLIEQEATEAEGAPVVALAAEPAGAAVTGSTDETEGGGP